MNVLACFAFQSLNSKLRNVKKNNGELNESEKAELDGVTKETNDMQKVIEKLRKEQKKHNTARTDHNNKRQSSQPAGVPGGPPGMAGLATNSIFYLFPFL